ncbi:MAG TPA: FHA domain-containing protein [Thermoanaerobaculia bacterium]|nr:FHA domain-containing protein [Thermoanaerobaculia bacterium]
MKIEGFVTQFVEAGSRSTSFFYLKDDWGAVIKVRTSNETPSVGKRYAIEGPVGLDPRTRDLYVSEESRVELFKSVEPTTALVGGSAISPPTNTASTSTAPLVPPKQTTASTTTSATTTDVAVQPPPPTTPITTYLLIGAAAVLVLIAAIFLMLRARRDEMPTEDYTLAAATRVDAPPPPEQVIEGRTIKLHAPPPNTVKLLPGWFDVVGGDDVVKQIRFYSLGGERGAETTFGRAAGRPYAHIQLKAPTVSSRQAKVAFDNGSAQLTNLASSDSNPTKVNGREMGVNESVPLSESDRVEMGEVSLLFHIAPGSTVSTRTANA